MPSDHPPSPQSPTQQPFDTIELPGKVSTSPNLANSLPTPAHSINGSMSSSSDLPAFADPTNLDDISNKRKRDQEDDGDREQKKIQVEDSRRLDIGELHENVGPKFKLCSTPHPAPTIRYDQDLFQLYGLNDLAKSVARLKPDGDKNVLRKSYKGYITKTFKLSGAFDSVKQELHEPDTLIAMMREPDELWEARFASAAKELKLGLPQLTVQQLPRAMTMAKGIVPKDDWNDKVLGITDAGKLAPTDQVKVAQNGAKTPVYTGGAQRVLKGEVPRPKRNIKKRTYGDASYEGYGEGFVDDDLQENGGYSTGGDADDRAGSRKRIKKFGTNQASAVPRQNSYGPGSIGV